MRAIIEELQRPRERAAVRDHDIMAFQEMWSLDTFRMFADSLQESHPYSHYYNGSALGSGLAIFSRYPIIRISFHKFVLNGNPARIFDGDWYVGKGVAHAQIQHPKGIIDFFTTHLIADYSNDNIIPLSSLLQSHRRKDEYMSHRLTQAYEMMQFAQDKVHPKAIACFLVGDFNVEMDSLTWRAFVDGNSNLQSIYSGLPQRDIPCTCNCPLNGYSKKRSKPSTIDHILYSGKSLLLSNFDLAFTGEIPLSIQAQCNLLKGCPRSYSDHFGLSAVFQLHPRSEDQRKPKIKSQTANVFKEVVGVLRDAQKTTTEQQQFTRNSWIILSGVLVMAMVLTSYIMASPNVQPTLPFYILFSLIPLVCASIVINLLMNWLQYPSDYSALGQYAAEIDFFAQQPFNTQF